MAAITHFEDLKEDENMSPSIHEKLHYSYLDTALLGSHSSDPKTLDKALRGPKSKHWQEALEYEINQLEKLGTLEVEDLPAGHTAIPCSEVLKVKRGPNGKVQSYRARIVARGHRQIEGVNYTETFSAAAKMPTVHVVWLTQPTRTGRLNM